MIQLLCYHLKSECKRMILCQISGIITTSIDERDWKFQSKPPRRGKSYILFFELLSPLRWNKQWKNFLAQNDLITFTASENIITCLWPRNLLFSLHLLNSYCIMCGNYGKTFERSSHLSLRCKWPNSREKEFASSNISLRESDPPFANHMQ